MQYRASSDAHRFQALRSAIADVALGEDGKQRARTARALAAAGCYAVVIAGTCYGIEVGVLQNKLTLYLQMLYLAIGPISFYGLLRSGWSLRLADPAMTEAQMGFAVLSILVGYVTVVPLRPALIVLLALVLMFGALTLPPAEERRLCVRTACALALTIAGDLLLHPGRSHPAVEFAVFGTALAALVSMSVLGSQIARLRAHLGDEKSELSLALDRLEQLASQDELTGLTNRRRMEELLGWAFARRGPQGRESARGEGELFCVCLLDIDHFKRINDTWGHAAGDAVLRQFAGQASRAVREVDVLSRWGGEEFLLLLPGTSIEQAVIVVERLRTELAQLAPVPGHPEAQVTFSAGLSQRVSGDTVEQLLGRADAALYRAKRAGRNRSEIAELHASAEHFA